MRESVTSKARRRAAVAPKRRRRSYTCHGVKLLCPQQGLYQTPDGLWEIEDDETYGWQLRGPGHPEMGTSVADLEAGVRIIKAAQEAEVTA